MRSCFTKLIHFRKFLLGLLGYNFQLIHYKHFSSGLDSMSALHVHFRKVSFNTSKVRMFLAPKIFALLNTIGYRCSCKDESFLLRQTASAQGNHNHLSNVDLVVYHRQGPDLFEYCKDESLTENSQWTRWHKYHMLHRAGYLGLLQDNGLVQWVSPREKCSINRSWQTSISQFVEVFTDPFFHKTFFCVLDMVQIRKYEFAGLWIRVGLLGQWDNAIASWSLPEMGVTQSSKWLRSKSQVSNFRQFLGLTHLLQEVPPYFPLLLMATHQSVVFLWVNVLIWGFVAFNEKSFQTCQPRWLLPAQLRPQSLSTICFCGGSIALELPSHPSHPWFQ